MPREHLKWKCKSERAKAGAKSERAKRELEGKLPPFCWFFLLVFFLCFVFFVFEKKKTMVMCHRILLWRCSNKKGDGSSLPLLSFLVVLKQRRQQ